MMQIILIRLNYKLTSKVSSKSPFSAVEIIAIFQVLVNEQEYIWTVVLETG
jgi:hypothetical protein